MSTLLRKLRIMEVSSVDSAANPHARVLLAKRHRQTEEKTMKKCPNCGHEAGDAEFEKRATAKAEPLDATTIQKATQTVHEDIARRLMADTPGLSFTKAMAAATSTPEYSDLVRDERRARIGW